MASHPVFLWAFVSVVYFVVGISCKPKIQIVSEKKFSPEDHERPKVTYDEDEAVESCLNYINSRCKCKLVESSDKKRKSKTNDDEENSMGFIRLFVKSVAYPNVKIKGCPLSGEKIEWLVCKFSYSTEAGDDETKYKITQVYVN